MYLLEECAKPSAQLPKHIKSLQDDTKHAVMKPETSMNWSNPKNMYCAIEYALHIIIVQYICADASRFICQIDESAKSHQA